MKANELRIGNWYENNGIPRQVSPSTIEAVWGVERFWCKPIDLTQDWLLSFGWVRQENIFRMGKYWIELRDNEKYGVLIYFGCFDFKKRIYFLEIGKELKYVHELQNLYFSLTGKDLLYEGNNYAER
jgi:hypothetical protein